MVIFEKTNCSLKNVSLSKVADLNPIFFLFLQQAMSVTNIPAAAVAVLPPRRAPQPSPSGASATQPRQPPHGLPTTALSPLAPPLINSRINHRDPAGMELRWIVRNPGHMGRDTTGQWQHPPGGLRITPPLTTHRLCGRQAGSQGVGMSEDGNSSINRGVGRMYIVLVVVVLIEQHHTELRICTERIITGGREGRDSRSSSSIRGWTSGGV